MTDKGARLLVAGALISKVLRRKEAVLGMLSSQIPAQMPLTKELTCLWNT